MVWGVAALLCCLPSGLAQPAPLCLTLHSQLRFTRRFCRTVDRATVVPLFRAIVLRYLRFPCFLLLLLSSVACLCYLRFW